MAQTFGTFLDQQLTAKRLTPYAFTRLVGLTPITYIYKILDGKRPPPAAKLAAMAEALELSERDRKAFFLLALAAHIPAEVQEVFAALGHEFGRGDVAYTAELANRLASAKARPGPRRRGRRAAP